MSTPAAILKRALEHHQAGRVVEAEAAFAELLEAAKHDATAALLLANHAEGQDKRAGAVKVLRRFLDLNGPNPDICRTLALFCLHEGALSEAQTHARTAHNLEPESPLSLDVLGRVFLAQNRLDEAETHFQQIVDTHARYPNAHNGLGRVAAKRKQHEMALVHFQAALALVDEWPIVLLNIGRTQLRLGRTREGIEYLDRATQKAPKFAAAWLAKVDGLLQDQRGDEALETAAVLLALENTAIAHDAHGRALAAVGQLPQARAAFERARGLAANPADVLNNLAALERADGNPLEAKSLLEQALSLDPNRVEYWNNLGLAELDSDDVVEAMACFEHGLGIDPHHAPIRLNLALLQWQIGDCERTIHTLEEGIAHQPNHFALQSRVHMARHYSPRFAAARLRSGSQQVADLVHQNGQRPPRSESIRRLALVSADIRQHPIGMAILDMIPAWQEQGVEVHVYSNGLTGDALGRSIEQRADQWVDCRWMSDAMICHKMRSESIDLAIDLSGHTHGHRLTAFGMGLAGLQFTWMGFFGTTGLTCFDGIVGDPIVTPEEHQLHYSEPLFPLDRCYFAISPSCLPNTDTTPPPSIMDGRIRFGCFNNPCKINLDVARTWISVLHACPESTLQLRYPSAIPNQTQGRLRRLFEDAGLEPERLLLHDGVDRNSVFGAYNHIDIALDPSPVNGGVSTIEALWMGVPVLGVAGDRFSARIGQSMVSAVGHPEWVVPNNNELAVLAARLGADVDRRLELRRNLRQRLQQSPLLDPRGLAQSFLAAAQKMDDVR